MAYSESLANRMRTSLQSLENVEVKAMMGGLCFMVNEKMCVSIIKDDLMCRVDPEFKPELPEKQGCFEMMFTSKPMKAFVQLDETGLRSQADFDFWIQQCLDLNPKAKASKKRKSKDQ
jgi:TfoX/Sxy family transcriptional regulator of competence genes